MYTCNPSSLAAALLALTLLGGCAKTAVQHRSEVANAGIARPTQVNVYAFAVDPATVLLNAGPLARLPANADADPTAEKLEIGREVADALAIELTARITALGFNAVRAEPETPVAATTLLVTGAFAKIDEGNRARRTVIGLGAGQSSLATSVRVLAPPGPAYRELLAFEARTDSGQLPGALVLGPAGAAAGAGTAAVVTSNAALGAVKSYRSAAAQQARQQADHIASELATYFARQGWIAPARRP